jgi:hypothetical protein
MPLVYPKEGSDEPIRRSPEPARDPATSIANAGELHHDEQAVRDSQARASGKGAAWTKRRNGFRSL